MVFHWTLITPYGVTMSTLKNSIQSIDVQLREVQSARGWTIQQMADLAGLSKNSMQNYMRKSDPQRPGTDAIIAMALGFGVSADWLLGIEKVPEAHQNTQSSKLSPEQRLTVERAFRIQTLQMLRYILHDWEHFGPRIFEDGKYMGADPEAQTEDYTESFMKIVDEMAEYGDLVAPLYRIRR